MNRFGHKNWSQENWERAAAWSYQQKLDQQARGQGYHSAWEALSPGAKAFQIIVTLAVMGFIAWVAISVFSGH